MKPHVPASRLYKNYLLGVLLVIQTFNVLDGVALGLVLQNIKVSLHLSDTQLGFLSGLAFAFFYSVMGIPIARWADRGDRVMIISLCAALWSVMVALCGTARSFLQLLLIRIGVAVGEAGCLPPAHSLIADCFSRVERPRGAAIYMLAVSCSMFIGYFLAGWLNSLYGWRAMFVLLGLPGLIPAAIAWFTLKEPRRAKAQPATDSVATGYQSQDPYLSTCQPRFTEVIVTLWRSSTFRHLLLFFSVVYFFGYGILQWQPAFFIRSYGLASVELGTWFAVIYGVGGFLGTYWGGELASRYAPHNERLQLRLSAIAYASLAAFYAAIYVSPNRYLAFGWMALASVGSAATIGPLFATIQTLVHPRMRAMSIAIIYLFANLIGLGLGPLVAGALSDAFRPLLGEESLRYALLTLCPGYLWGGWHLWRASSTVTHDLAAIQGNLDTVGPSASFVARQMPAGGYADV
jgi:MFS family permease